MYNTTEQLNNEMDMIDLGLRRYREAMAKRDVTMGDSLLESVKGRDMIQKLTDSIEKSLEEQETSKKRKASYYKLLSSVEPVNAAYLAVRSMLGVSDEGRMKFNDMAHSLGKVLESEAQRQAMAEANPQRYAYAVRQYAGKEENYRERGLDWMYLKTDEEVGLGMYFAEVDRAQAAAALVNSLIVMYPSSFSLLTEKGFNKGRPETVIYVVASEMLIQQAEGLSKIYESNASPRLFPMVIPPQPWDGKTLRGGFYSKILQDRHRLIRGVINRHVSGMVGKIPQKVIDAVNTVQETQWEINEEISKMVDKAVFGKWGYGKLPFGIDFIPQSPFPGIPLSDLDEVQLEILKDNNKKREQAYSNNAAAMQLSKQVIRTNMTAKQFTGRPIWMPWSMDFRGRLYPSCEINPQGSDLHKGLLQFHKGSPIMDQESANWLYIHAAGVWGNDKVSMQDRIKWVEDNREYFMMTLEDPEGMVKWWSQADKPWSFLAVALDIARFMKEGFGYISKIPVHMDATASGIQILSAMGRNPEAAPLVNLTQGDKQTPNDIYMIVRDRVVEMMDHDIDNPPLEERVVMQQLLKFREEFLDRKLFKKVVMTLPYGSKDYGIKDTLAGVIKSRKEMIRVFGEKTDLKVAKIVAKYTIKAIKELLPETVIMRDQIKGYCKLFNKANMQFAMVTPDGFPMVQRVEKSSLKQLRTKSLHSFSVVTHTMSYKKFTKGAVDTRAALDSCSPNVIHALDSTHARQTVLECSSQYGMTQFHMIHDSFGVPAGEAPLLAKAIRDSFVDIHSAFNLDKALTDSIKMNLGDDVETPEVLPLGDLDLEEIKSSTFFFS